jgi:hypothetical protein
MWIQCESARVMCINVAVYTVSTRYIDEFLVETCDSEGRCKRFASRCFTITNY